MSALLDIVDDRLRPALAELLVGSGIAGRVCIAEDRDHIALVALGLGRKVDKLVLGLVGNDCAARVEIDGRLSLDLPLADLGIGGAKFGLLLGRFHAALLIGFAA